MCMSCGCMQPNNNHGDNRNITQEDVNRAAQAAGITPQQAADNIAACCRQTETGTQASQNQQQSSSAG